MVTFHFPYPGHALVTWDMEITASEPTFAQYLAGRGRSWLTAVADCGTLYMGGGCMLFDIHSPGVQIHHGYSSYPDHPPTRMSHVHIQNSRSNALFMMDRGCMCPVWFGLLPSLETRRIWAPRICDAHQEAAVVFGIYKLNERDNFMSPLGVFYLCIYQGT